MLCIRYAVVPPSPNPGPATQPQLAIDHYDAVSTFHDDDFCEARLSKLPCSGCLELTTENCRQQNSVTVFKSRLKTFLFSRAFSLPSSQ